MGKGTWNMVVGEMVLMRGVWCGTLYKLLGRTYTDGCNNSTFPKKINKEYMIHIILGKKIML
jgi:hypothetical protein